jgi:Fic family protein
VLRAINGLHAYIDRRAKETADANAELRGLSGLNHRQRALIAHALGHPKDAYSITYHQNANKVVYETARRDLLGLATRGFLTKRKVGKTWIFTSPPNLHDKLRRAK